MLTKNRSILILGILVALMPFLGLPAFYENTFYVIVGVSIAILAFLIARHKRANRLARRSAPKAERITDVYAETAPPSSKNIPTFEAPQTPPETSPEKNTGPDTPFSPESITTDHSNDAS